MPKKSLRCLVEIKINSVSYFVYAAAEQRPARFGFTTLGSANGFSGSEEVD